MKNKINCFFALQKHKIKKLQLIKTSNRCMDMSIHLFHQQQIIISTFKSEPINIITTLCFNKIQIKGKINKFMFTKIRGEKVKGYEYTWIDILFKLLFTKHLSFIMLKTTNGHLTLFPSVSKHLYKYLNHKIDTKLVRVW